MKKKTYCIIGRKRVGKDLTADYICKKTGCKKYALATPLKEMVCNMTGITMEQLDRFKNEHWDFDVSREDRLGELNISFRSILQKAGDEMKGFFGLDCYMRKLHEKLLDEEELAVPDVRLGEEQEWLLNNTNPIFIKVVRDVEKDKDSSHRTETEVDKLGYDILIENNGTIEELYEKIDKILSVKSFPFEESKL